MGGRESVSIQDLDVSGNTRWQVFGVNDGGEVETWSEISSQNIHQCGLGNIVNCGDWNFLLMETSKGLTSFQICDNDVICHEPFVNSHGPQFIEGKKAPSWQVDMENADED